jgi:hypothetical protein
MSKILWTVQGLLAALFLFAGIMKLITPVETMTRQMPMSGLFLHFIGVAEICGAIGLVLPGVLRIRPGLTPLAAAGLWVIMVGATAITLRIGPPVQALFPLVCGLLSAWVAWARWRLVPLRGRA